jgi:hypothetical protein
MIIQAGMDSHSLLFMSQEPGPDVGCRDGQRNGCHLQGTVQWREIKEGVMDADRTDRVKPDYGTMIGVFMVIFWPLSLLLGIADTWFIAADYDLRLVNLAVATFAASVGVMVFEVRRRRSAERERAERENSLVEAENPGWLAYRGQSSRE